jgi:hypothetical protein
MRIARLLLLISVFLALVVVGCTRATPKPRMTEQDVIRVAKAEMTIRFPDSVAKHEPYHADFRQGSWSVWGTVPGGTYGGGASEAVVRDSDGTVTNVYLSR